MIKVNILYDMPEADLFAKMQNQRCFKFAGFAKQFVASDGGAKYFLPPYLHMRFMTAWKGG